MLDLGPTVPLSVLPLRFWSKVNVTESGCWLWQSHINWQGYPIYWNPGSSQRAHIVIYEALRGPVPIGKELDHLCNKRSCVSIFHLDAATHKENMTRALRTHCRKGHPLWGPNLLLLRRRGGERVCRTCDNSRRREARLLRS